LPEKATRGFSKRAWAEGTNGRARLRQTFDQEIAMLKKLLMPAALLLGLTVPASAFAAYVCQTEYFPGSIARIKLVTTGTANCGGATTTYWICEPTNTSTTCGTLRYTVPELLSLQSSLVSAAKTQQVIFPSLTTCTGGTGNCLYSVAFKQ
jgi:hypothetical protein